MLELKTVSKRVGEATHIDSVSMTMEPGSLNVLLGPTLSGKTSLMRLMAGLDRPTGGEVWVDGANVTGLPVQKRDVAMVYQQFINYPAMTVYENIASPLRIKRVGEEEIDQRVRVAAALMKLNDQQLGRKPLELSGGQQQRVAIARSLAMNPDVMLFDEVTAALDPETVKEVLVTIRELAEDGMTCILVTHEMGFAREVADHIYFTDRGVIVEHGPPAAFFTEASDPRTKEFLGQIL